MRIDVKKLALAGVLAIGGLVGVAPASAQYSPNRGNPGPFPPRPDRMCEPPRCDTPPRPYPGPWDGGCWGRPPQGGCFPGGGYPGGGKGDCWGRPPQGGCFPQGGGYPQGGHGSGSGRGDGGGSGRGDGGGYGGGFGDGGGNRGGRR